MTKYEVKEKLAAAREQVKKYTELLEKMEQTFTIDDSSKPFVKWSVNEIQQLYDISKPAFYWFVGEETGESNQDKSIDDYNSCHSIKIILTK